MLALDEQQYIFFAIVIFIGAYCVLNLFVAVLVNYFGDSDIDNIIKRHHI